MFWIILFLIIGILLFFAELFIIPGLSIAALAALCSLAASVWLAFAWFTPTVGYVILSIAIGIIIIMTIIFLRAKTWSKLSLKTNIDSSVNNNIRMHSKTLKGQKAQTLGRLAPMGQIVLKDGSIIEARCLTSYIDPRTEVIIKDINDTHAIVEPLLANDNTL